MSSPEPSFSLQPVHIPDDYPGMLDVSARAFANEPMTRGLFPRKDDDTMTDAETEFRLLRLRNLYEGKNGMRARSAKYVLESPSPALHEQTRHASDKKNPMVAYCFWQAPHKRGVTETTAAEQEAFAEAIRKSQEAAADGAAEATASQERIYKRLEEYSDEVLGKDRDYRFWYLGGLQTVPEWQRRGLGLALVKWGMELAEKEAKDGAEEVDRVKGVYTVATAEGLRTYLKAGMEQIGSETLEYESGKTVTFVWLAKIF